MVSGTPEVDGSLMPAASGAKFLQEHAALTGEGSEFFHTNHYSSDAMENDDAESVSVTNDGHFGGNASIGNGNHAGKLYNWEDYMGSIDMYSESSDYDYGKYIEKSQKKIDRNRKIMINCND